MGMKLAATETDAPLVSPKSASPCLAMPCQTGPSLARAELTLPSQAVPNQTGPCPTWYHLTAPCPTIPDHALARPASPSLTAASRAQSDPVQIGGGLVSSVRVLAGEPCHRLRQACFSFQSRALCRANTQVVQDYSVPDLVTHSFPVQPFGCETAVLRTPVAKADLTTGNPQPRVKLGGVDECILNTECHGSGPFRELGAHPHHTGLPDSNLGREAESLVGPQRLSRARPIVFQQGVLQAKAARLSQPAFLHLLGTIDNCGVDHGVRKDGAVGCHVEASEELDARHFLIVGIGFLALARDRLQQFGPFVQRVGRLAVVLQERGRGCQLVMQGLPSHV